MGRSRLLGVWAALLLAPVAAARPLPVHAIVLADPHDGEPGQQSARGIASLLRGSGAYDLVDPAVLEGRVGESPGALYRRCFNDVACWRTVGEQAGLEQVVLVERVDAGTLGVRVVDVVVRGPFRTATSPVGAGGFPRVSLLDELFFQPGGLRLVDAAPGTLLRLDGEPPVSIEAEHAIAPLPAGKHVIELSAEGRAPLFAALLVRPGEVTEVSASLPALDRDRSPTRWGRWAAVGLAAGGLAAVALGAASAGIAVTP